jgi:hypothetical protein
VTTEMSGDVHPLVRMYCPADKPMWLYASNRLIAEGWAATHGVEDWRYVGPKDVRKIKMKVKIPVVILYDYERKLIRSLQECGFFTITPEGFHYRHNFS